MKVVLHFKGGLGNQLIQYAFCQRFMENANVDLIFDISHYKFYKKRKFFLGNFPHAKISRWEYLNVLLKLYFRIIIKKLQDKGLNFSCKNTLSNYIDDNYDVTSLNELDFDYLFINGYFQHSMLFPLADRNSLTMWLDKLSVKEGQSETVSLIKSSPNPIMFHLRCGDYLKDEHVRKIMGTCSCEYYRKGLELLTKGLNEYSLFVFSDDIDYARNYFSEFKTTYFIKGDIDNPLQDFFLMRCFERAVIPNSTLSYMALMLSSYKDNMVVIPNPWFDNGKEFLLGKKNSWNYVDKN